MWEAVKSFPEFILGMILGLIQAILTDAEVFLLVVLGVLLSIGLDNGWLGSSIALGLYITFRMQMQFVGVLRGKPKRN